MRILYIFFSLFSTFVLYPLIAFSDSNNYRWNQFSQAIPNVQGASLNSDGTILAVGLGGNLYPQISGYVKVFSISNSELIQLGNDISNGNIGDKFGHSISLSGDGSRIAIASKGSQTFSKSVKVFDYINGQWQQVGDTIGLDWITYGYNSSSNYGEFTISLSGDGETLAVSYPRSGYGSDNYGSHDGRGHVAIYNITGNSIHKINDIYGNKYDYLGTSLSLSFDGENVAIGAPEIENLNFNAEGPGYLLLNNSTFIVRDPWNNPISGATGYSISLNKNGNVLAIGSPKNNYHYDYENQVTGNSFSFGGGVFIYRKVGNSSWQMDSEKVYGNTNERAGTFVNLRGNGNMLAYSKDNTLTDTYNDYGVFLVDISSENWLPVGDRISGHKVYLNNDGTTIAVIDENDNHSLSLYNKEAIPDPFKPVLQVSEDYDILLNGVLSINGTPSDGFPEIYSYQWYFNNFAIPSHLGGTLSTYLIDGIQSNEGEWKVEVTNDAGTTTHSFTVNIVEDSDSDGIYNYKETNTGIYVSLNDTGTDPNNEDTDGDTILDNVEIANGTNPNLYDTDSDGLDDSQEASYNSDPNLADTSGDGLKDGEVVNAGFDPTVDYTNLKNIISQGVQELRPGSTMIEVSGNQATVQLQMEESSDLQTWQDTGTPATMTLPADTDTKFFRFKMAE